MKKYNKINPILTSLSCLGGMILPITSCSNKAPETTKCTVSFTADEHCTISPNSIQVEKGTEWWEVEAQVTVTPAKGYILKEWQKDGEVLKDEYEIKENITAKAISKEEKEYELITSLDDNFNVESCYFSRVYENKDYYALLDMKTGFAIDTTNTKISVGGTDITSHCEIRRTYLFIPAQYITGDLNITLKSVAAATYTVNTSSSSKDITFINIPNVITKGDYVFGKYSYETQLWQVDTTNTDILVGNKSIKDAEGVQYKNETIVIPADLINDNLTIKIVLQQRTGYSVSTEGSSDGVSFTHIPSTVSKGESVAGNYSFDSFTMRIDETSTDILVGGQSIKTKEGVICRDGSIYIPSDYITGDIQINIITKSLVLTQTMTEVIQLCNDYHDAKKTKDAFIKSFKTSSGNIQSEDELIGCLFKVMINGKEHFVRIIGVEHDTVTYGWYSALTCELATLLSDSNGNAMTSWWEKTNPQNYDYLNSLLRSNLDDGGSQGQSWDTTAYEMLPEELQKAIRKQTKTVAFNSTKTPGSSNYKPTLYDTYLFPLTYTEMALSGSPGALVEGKKYKHWEKHTANADRVKKDANGVAHQYWLASPNVTGSTSAYVICENGEIGSLDVNGANVGVSFAFCL